MRPLWDAHVASGALVTLGLMPHPQPGRYGGVVIDDESPIGIATPDARSRLPLPTRRPEPRCLAAGAVTAFVPRTSPCRACTFPASRSCTARCSPICRTTPCRERARGVSATDGDAAPVPSAARSSMRISTTSGPSTTTAAHAARWPATPTATSSIPGPSSPPTLAFAAASSGPVRDVPPAAVLDDVVVTGHTCRLPGHAPHEHRRLTVGHVRRLRDSARTSAVTRLSTPASAIPDSRPSAADRRPEVDMLGAFVADSDAGSVGERLTSRR